VHLLRHAVLVFLVSLTGCGSHTVTATSEGLADASGSETGDEVNASAIVGCAPDDGPLLVFVEDPICGPAGLWSDDGFNVRWSPSGEDFEDLIGTHDVLSEPWGLCRLCSDGNCEDASSCLVEITEASDTHILAQLDAVFPSGPLSRELHAVVCPLEGFCY
jgi:hypothetical protein